MHCLTGLDGPKVEVENAEPSVLHGFDRAYTKKLETDDRARGIVRQAAKLGVKSLVVDFAQFIDRFQQDTSQRYYVIIYAPPNAKPDKIVDKLLEATEAFICHAAGIRIEQGRGLLSSHLQQYEEDGDDWEWAAASIVELLDPLSIDALWDEIPVELKPHVLDKLEVGARTGVVMEYQPWDVADIKANAEKLLRIAKVRGWASADSAAARTGS